MQAYRQRHARYSIVRTTHTVHHTHTAPHTPPPPSSTPPTHNTTHTPTPTPTPTQPLLPPLPPSLLLSPFSLPSRSLPPTLPHPTHSHGYQRRLNFMIFRVVHVRRRVVIGCCGQGVLGIFLRRGCLDVDCEETPSMGWAGIVFPRGVCGVAKSVCPTDAPRAPHWRSGHWAALCQEGLDIPY